ncbi:MAG: tripartite tricarboxylate transporter substrate binding protein [Oxalobacteraceae bacterium]|nr:MAG: tripartite tricarboxylate transporter substrate binding protein [Oxalobacteraceae bacterium]
MFCKIGRLVAASLLLGPLLGLAPAGAGAQTYPSKPVRLVVGFAPGGGTDILARLLAQKLSEELGQPFIVDNRAGATGMIGAKLVATAPADGYTLLMGHVNSQAIAPALMENPQYDPVKDFAPVAYLGFVPNVLVVPAKLPVKSVAELVAWAKARPEGLSYASPGVGSTNHLAGELFRMDSGAKLIHVPYRGSGPATVDLLAGQVDMNFDALPSALANIRAGLLRPLAVTTPQRDPELPDVPTMAELGFKTFDITNWYGVVAPVGTPPATVATLHAAIQRVLLLPDVARKLSEWSVRGEPMGTVQFGGFMRAESAKYRDIAQRTGVRLER